MLYNIHIYIHVLQNDHTSNVHYTVQSTCISTVHCIYCACMINFLFWWIKGDLRTICRFSYMKVYKLITLGTKFKTLLSLGRKITMFSKFITNYIEQGWWHSSLTLKCMHLLLKEVNKRGRHAYNLQGWTCLPSGIVMEIYTLPQNKLEFFRLLWGWGCHLVVQCNLFMIFQSIVIRVCYQNNFPNF